MRGSKKGSSKPACRRAHRVGVVLTMLAVTMGSTRAWAGANMLFGSMPRAMALAGAYTALSEDASGLYYNPAGLSAVDGSYVGVTFLLAVPSFSAKRGDDRLRLKGASDDGYGLHLAWSPRSLFSGALGFGFSVLLPHRRALRFAVHKFDDPYFVLFENSIEVLEVRLGAAYEVFEGLSVGVSTLLLAGLDGTVEIASPFQDADPAKQDPNKRAVVALDALLPNRAFFTAGARYRATRNLRLGVSYRQATYVPITLPIDFTVELFGLSPIRTVASLDLKVKYAPAELNFGLAYQLDPSLLLCFDLSFSLYARYKLPYGNLTIDRGLSSDLALLAPREPSTRLRNIWLPRLGIEWQPSDSAKLRVGYAYARSFIRSTDAPVLDSDRHSFTVGGSYALGRLFLDDDADLDLTAAGQAIEFTPRKTAGIAHSGLALAATLGAEFRY